MICHSFFNHIFSLLKYTFICAIVIVIRPALIRTGIDSQVESFQVFFDI